MFFLNNTRHSKLPNSFSKLVYGPTIYPTYFMFTHILKEMKERRGCMCRYFCSQQKRQKFCAFQGFVFTDYNKDKKKIKEN